MSEVSVQDWEFSKSDLKTAIMGRFPFHLNWWSTWGLHQALQIPQYPSPLACCQLSRAGRASHRHSHHQWVACPSIPAVKGKVEQQKRLPKPLVKSNAAILPAWERGKCVFKHCACVRMPPWCKVFVSKKNPYNTGTSMLWWTAWIPKKGCRGKWRCLVVLQRKGYTFHLFLSFYWPKPKILQPLEPSLPGCSSGKA